MHIETHALSDAGARHGSLRRELGLLGLAATGICAMLGAGIMVVPFMLQRNVPGIGPHVLPAYFFAAIPALFAALAYAILASAMPRAGGSYVFASRVLHPYLGFAASFSQWFGLSIAIGVVSYVLIPFLRDMAATLGYTTVAAALDTGGVRVGLALAFLWTFVIVNVRGVRLYERTLVPLMFAMFALGCIVIVAGFWFDHADFAAAILEREARVLGEPGEAPLRGGPFLAAAAVLFSSFIGFDAIAQAGGEARDPGRTMPLAILIAVATVGTFYLLFTAAVYHAVPWSYVAEQAHVRDATAPGLLAPLLSRGWTVAIVAGAAIALINDLPAMLLAVSRLMFAWAEDGIFPRAVGAIHARWSTPHVAIVLSGAMASLGIFGSHLAGDFFLGVDILVLAMLVNFLLMCISVVFLHRRRALARAVTVFPGRAAQLPIGLFGSAMILLFLIIHVWKDLSTGVERWWFHSTYAWLAVMAIASLIYLRELRRLRASGADVDDIFSRLPAE